MTEPLIQSNAQPSSSSVCCTDAERTEPLDWRQAHRELSRLAEQRAALDWEEGRWLLCALRSRAHQQLGFGTFAEYVQRLFGYKPRTTEEKLRVAQALERLPQLEQALHEGVVNWSTVRELTRVATPDNEGAWLGCAQGRTLQEIEQLVAGRRAGDGPDAPSDPSREKHVLRFEVQAETLAWFRLLCLCVAHHRAQHRGQLIIQGRVSAGLSFCHADGTRYGETVSPEHADTQTRVFRILRSLGFGETQTRAALGRVRAEARVELNSTEQVLRAALAVLTPAARLA